MRHRITAVRIIAVMALMGGVAQRATLQAGEPAAPTVRSRLRVTIANDAGARDVDLGRAGAAVVHELTRIGIDVVWTIEPRAGASAHPGTEERVKFTDRSIMLVLLSSDTGARLSQNASDQVLGMALPSVSRAYLFYARIEDVAREAGVSIPEPLTYVMLHEIGHLLLSDGHAEVGLMRATLPKLGVATVRQFTHDQEARLRLATRVVPPDVLILTASAENP
jgi:hypothetical protein